jgi:tripartite-type tricarboxylate transporter receptor subunit TctC
MMRESLPGLTGCFQGDVMKLSRRKLLHLGAAAAALPGIARTARAQSYPSRPVRLMVGFAAGQAIDILARLVGQSLSERLGQQFIIENRPGAGGNIATDLVVRSPPDGYTFIVIGANNAINASLYDNLTFNVLRDIVPVAGIYRVPQVMEVNPAFPAKSVSEFIAYAKANPGKVNFASAGSGSVAHVTGEYFKMMTGIQMQHIPFRGAPPALTALIGGQVDVMFDNMPSSIEHIKSGRLRPLGVCSTTRLPALPDVPPVAEVVPGFETSAFAGLGAPQGTPAEIIETINKGVNAGLADPKIAQRILDLGGTPMPLAPAAFGRLVADETEKWTKVVKFSGAKPG